MILEVKDIITIVSSIVSSIPSALLGGYLTLKVQRKIILSQEKKQEEERKKILEGLMNVIWKDKIEILYKPLLTIEDRYFDRECSSILVDISIYSPELISPSLIGDEEYNFLQFECNKGGILHDIVSENYLDWDKSELDRAKLDYQDIVLKSISELKELKKDIRSQPSNNYIEILMSLQKMINILETTFLSYADEPFIAKYIDDCVAVYRDCGDGDMYPEILPTDDNYLKLLNSKNQILEQVKQKIKQDTLFNKVKWENEVRVKK